VSLKDSTMATTTTIEEEEREGMSKTRGAAGTSRTSEGRREKKTGGPKQKKSPNNNGDKHTSTSTSDPPPPPPLPAQPLPEHLKREKTLRLDEGRVQRMADFVAKEILGLPSAADMPQFAFARGGVGGGGGGVVVVGGGGGGGAANGGGGGGGGGAATRNGGGGGGEGPVPRVEPDTNPPSYITGSSIAASAFRPGAVQRLIRRHPTFCDMYVALIREEIGPALLDAAFGAGYGTVREASVTSVEAGGSSGGGGGGGGGAAAAAAAAGGGGGGESSVEAGGSFPNACRGGGGGGGATGGEPGFEPSTSSLPEEVTLLYQFPPTLRVKEPRGGRGGALQVESS
jgi:hypothetical protein